MVQGSFQVEEGAAQYGSSSVREEKKKKTTIFEMHAILLIYTHAVGTYNSSALGHTPDHGAAAE